MPHLFSHPQPIDSPMITSGRSSRRSGRYAITIIGALVSCVLLVSLFLALSGRTSRDRSDVEVLLHRVQRTDFEAFVTEPGDVTSSNNVEVRCQVESRGGAGVAIVDICEEGTLVKEGDLLVQFDDSVLQNELIGQKIVVAQDKSAFIQAESNLANAERTLTEYEEGLFEQQAEVLESAAFVAEEELRKSDLMLQSNRRLAAKGLINELQVTASRFRMEKAKKDVAASRRALEVFRKFTRDRMIGEYKAEIEKQKANLDAARFTLDLSQQKLGEIQEQIHFCRITAPSEGQLVYANERQRGEPVVIEEGTYIRYNQVVARLPDIRNMQVEVKINESHINRIRPEMAARIILDADPDLPLRGAVSKVAPYPFPQRWHGAPVEYGVDVKIIDPPPTIRPGYRAKVQIFFEAQSQALQVPLAAVIAHDDGHYCLVREENGWRAQSVEIGPNNNNDVVIESGLDEDDRVSLTPFRFIDRDDLPKGSEQAMTAGRGAPRYPSKLTAKASEAASTAVSGS